jgi:hypothetical protein
MFWKKYLNPSLKNFPMASKLPWSCSSEESLEKSILSTNSGTEES